MIHINDVNGDDICWHINDVNGAIQCGFVLMLRWLKMGSHRELMWFHGDLMREIGRNQHEPMRHQQDVLSTFCHVICAKREIQPAKDRAALTKRCVPHMRTSAARGWTCVRRVKTDSAGSISIFFLNFRVTSTFVLFKGWGTSSTTNHGFLPWVLTMVYSM